MSNKIELLRDRERALTLHAMDVRSPRHCGAMLCCLLDQFLLCFAASENVAITTLWSQHAKISDGGANLPGPAWLRRPVDVVRKGLRTQLTSS